MAAPVTTKIDVYAGADLFGANKTHILLSILSAAARISGSIGWIVLGKQYLTAAISGGTIGEDVFSVEGEGLAGNVPARVVVTYDGRTGADVFSCVATRKADAAPVYDSGPLTADTANVRWISR